MESNASGHEHKTVREMMLELRRLKSIGMVFPVLPIKTTGALDADDMERLTILIPILLDRLEGDPQERSHIRTTKLLEDTL